MACGDVGEGHGRADGDAGAGVGAAHDVRRVVAHRVKPGDGRAGGIQNTGMGVYTFRARARLLLEDYEAAVEDARRAIRHPAASFWPHAVLAPALALLDRREGAKIALDKLLEVKPDFSPDAALSVYSLLKPEALRPQFTTWFDGLRKAGLDIPDEPAPAK